MNHTILYAVWLCAVLSLTQTDLCAAERVKDFTLPSARDSSLVRLSDYAGKVVLINWWRSSCGYSQREHPKMVALQQKYGPQGLVILGISDDTADTVADVPNYLKRQKITWPVGLNDQGEFMREISPKGSGDTPANYLVSRGGELTFLGLDRSEDSWKNLDETVARFLAEPAPKKPIIEPREFEAAADFSLSDLAGRNVSLKDFAGRPLMVNFFNAGTADWAGAVIAKLHHDFGNKGLQVVGINLFDEDANIKEYVEKYKIKYPLLRGDEATQRAWIGNNDAWGVFFVSMDGKIVKKITNSINNGLEEPVFRKYAEQLLSKKSTAAPIK